MNLWGRIRTFLGIPRLPIPVDLPPPATFPEGQRALFGCLSSLAGMAAFVFAVWVTRYFMTHSWDGEVLQGKVIDNLGWALLAALAVMSFVTIGLLVGGPVGRFKGGVGKDGANFEVEDNDVAERPQAVVTATAVAQVEQPAEPFNPGETP